jgi:hypothetical protein
MPVAIAVTLHGDLQAVKYWAILNFVVSLLALRQQAENRPPPGS